MEASHSSQTLDNAVSSEDGRRQTAVHYLQSAVLPQVSDQQIWSTAGAGVPCTVLLPHHQCFALRMCLVMHEYGPISCTHSMRLTVKYVSLQASRQPNWSCPKCLKNCSCSYCRKVTPQQLTSTWLTSRLSTNCISSICLCLHLQRHSIMDLLHFELSLST